MKRREILFFLKATTGYHNNLYLSYPNKYKRIGSEQYL